MALHTAVRPCPLFCRIKAEKSAVPEIQKVKVSADESTGKVVLQPRVCTLRSFGDDRGVIKVVTPDDHVPRFFEILTDYVESSKKSHDFEIISGRLAMMVFAATIAIEIATGNSVFRKVDLEGIEEGAGICLAAVTSAAIFAWFSSNRSRVGRMFSTGCNSFIDSVIDHIVDGLFYDTDMSDWSDESE